MNKILIVFCSLLLFLSSCVSFKKNKDQFIFNEQNQRSPYFIVFLVDARDLDYSTPKKLFKTLAKHPSDGSKNGDVGHAWIYMQGLIQDEPVYIEGGHSGEVGYLQPRYVDGFFQLIDQQDENPIRYFWETQKDGFFQWGSGGHRATAAIGVELTKTQFDKIIKFIDYYSFADYAITGNQCCTFVAQIASLIGLDLDCHLTLKIPNQITLAGQKMFLWQDSVYSKLPIATPDVLQQSFTKAVKEKKAIDCLVWAKKKRYTPPYFTKEDILLFPRRYIRYLCI